jgi:tRNA threonylcarbamoyl adenosine modification protein YjeE
MDEILVSAETTEAMLAWGGRVAEALRAAGVDSLLIALEGDLGAGKTVFVRGLGRALGVDAREPIVSPTFTIARDYGFPGPLLRELHHLDAYRLGGAEDLEAAGFEEMCGAGRLTCVEWSENVVDALPEDRLELEITLAPVGRVSVPEGDAPEVARSLRLRARGPRSARVLEALQTEASAGQTDGSAGQTDGAAGAAQ